MIPIEDMVEKIKVAAETRENMLIIARTDARQSEGLDDALRRLEAYAKAGADILFPEAMESEEEMRRACAAFDKPVMANMANGGSTPILKGDVLRDIGYAFAIYPSLSSLIAAAAIETAFIKLRDEGDGEPADHADVRLQGVLRPDRLPGSLGLREEVGALIRLLSSTIAPSSRELDRLRADSFALRVDRADMEITAAVLERTGDNPRPYADNRPLSLRTLTLDPPRPGELLIRIDAAGPMPFGPVGHQRRSSAAHADGAWP